MRIVEDEIYLHLRFPFEGELGEVLSERGLGVLPSWRIHKFRRGKKAVFAIRLADAETIAPFLDRVARDLYSFGADYRVMGVIEPNGVC